jgi:hypothetical protein
MLRDKYEEKKKDKPDRHVISRKAEEVWEKLCEKRKSPDDVSFYRKMIREIKHTTFMSLADKTSERQLVNLFNAPLHPQITILENGYGMVKTVTFTEWGGFSNRYDYIKCPNTIERIKSETLLYHDCGVEF